MITFDEAVDVVTMAFHMKATRAKEAQVSRIIVGREVLQALSAKLQVVDTEDFSRRLTLEIDADDEATTIASEATAGEEVVN